VDNRIRGAGNGALICFDKIGMYMSTRTLPAGAGSRRRYEVRSRNRWSLHNTMRVAQIRDGCKGS